MSLPSSQSTNSSTAADSASPNWPAFNGWVPRRRSNTSICVEKTTSPITASAVRFIVRLSNVSERSTDCHTPRHWYAATTIMRPNALRPIDDWVRRYELLWSERFAALDEVLAEPDDKEESR